MALRDLKSSLKNLKVDKDRPFGGSSGLPYIKGGLPEDSPAGEYLADLARYSSEGTVRGGLFSIVSSATDTIRVSRFLNDFPKGLLFTSKQIGLQKSNPKIETGTRGDVLNTQVYSNSNLLAQIALQGTGVHVPRPGFNTNDLLREENKYEKIVRDKTTDENRLVTLYNNKIAPASSKILLDNLDKLGISNLDNELFNYTGGPGSSYGDGDTFIPRVVNTNSSLSVPEDGVINYLGSLGLTDLIKTKSIPGLKDLLYPKKSREFVTPTSFQTPTTIGNASLQTPFVASNIDLSGGIENIDFEEGDFLQNIKVPKSRYQQASPDFIRPEKVPNGYTFSNTMAYSRLVSSVPGQLQDFRQFTDAQPLATSVSYFTGGRNNNGFNRETRIGLGNPGSRTKNQRNNFYEENYAGQDRVNMTPIYRKPITDPVEQDSDDVRDLIKFVIESIDNSHPDQTNRMHFRAFITNFSDNIGAEWDSQKYMGRGENFYTYQGFTREVGFTFVVAAQSVQEMEKMYQKLNYLASTLHPDYSPGGFMRGTIHQLTIGEYFYRTPGIINSMNITVEDNYPWEIKMRQPELSGSLGTTSVPANDDRGQMELPQILKIQMSFKPIMNRLPQKGLKEPILVSAGRNSGSLVANNYLERPNFNFQI
jgi:hypothetical protein